MKNIIYIIDSLSPLALKSLSNNFYDIKLKKKNYFDKLIDKSIIIENVYGYGETYATIYSALTGENIYKNRCDSWYIENSFNKNSNLGSIFKQKGFTNIFMRNVSPNNNLENFYGRYLRSLSKDFDYKYFKKRDKKHNFEQFLDEEKITNLVKNKNKNFFFLIHDVALHDDTDSYNGDHRKVLKKIENDIKNRFKKILKKINYNSKIDNLIVFSDHGLSRYPTSTLYTEKFVKKKDYDNNYKEMLKDEKIKMLFFINSPNIKKKIVIKGNYLATDLYPIIKNFFKKSGNIKKFVFLVKKLSRKYIITSIRSSVATVYENFFDKNIFHNHIIFIKDSKKLTFSHKHPNKFLLEKNNKFEIIKKNKIDQIFLDWINDYYSLSNKTIKIFFYSKYLFKRLIIKILRLLS